MTNKKPKKEFLHADEQDDREVKKRKVSDFLSLISLIRETKQFSRGYLFSTILIITSTIFAVYSARITGKFVEQGLAERSLDKAWYYASILLFLEFIHIATSWWGKRLFSLYSGKTLLTLREKLISKLHRLPISYFDHHPQGRIVTRITHDVEGVENFFASSLGRFLTAFFMSIFSMIAMVMTDMKLGLTMIALIIPGLIFIWLTRNKIRKANRKLSRTNSNLNARLSENLSGMEVVRAFGLEKWSKDEYDHHIDEYQSAHLDANLFYSWIRPFTDFLTIIPMIALLYIAGKDVLSGSLPIGILVSFIRYYDRFYVPLVNMTREIHLIQQAFTGAERILLFLHEDEESDLFKGDGTRLVDRLDGKIQFKDVTMNYGTDLPQILKGVSFCAEPGSKIGLVGRTGCGKTTTVSLISRLYDFNGGEIFIDDLPIREINRYSLRRQIGLVTQDVMIFAGTLRDNLLCARELTDDEIIAAASTTGLLTIMDKNRLTLDSSILEGGTNLSVGERQLLSLTRILLGSPSILILDEATANIDPLYEEIIHRAIDKMMKGRTCLIIAHRLDTLRDVDRVIVFSEGEIVEEGPLDKLMMKKGYFYQLQKSSEALT